MDQDQERDYAEEAYNAALLHDEDELELSGAELVAEHTGRTCGAERPSGAWEGRTYVCVEPVGHGGPHRDPRFSAEWFDGLTTVLDPFRVSMTRDASTTTAPERGDEGQDRESYTDDQDRDSYTVEEPEPDAEHEAFADHHDAGEGR
jgi:hypothetical protein